MARGPRLGPVTPADAVVALEALLIPQANQSREPDYLEWRSKCLAILRASFGPGSEQVTEFERASEVRKEPYTLAKGPARDLEMYREAAVARGRGVLRGHIYALETVTGESLLDDASIDPELWAHVQGLVLADDWAKVPASVAIFLEDKVRTWAGDPRTSKGEVMIGTALYAAAMRPDGPLRLGGQGNEQEGWRFLGQGPAQALGNVDRHRIQRRQDVKRYAMGVLGLGSLLLTQLRFEHPAEILNAEARAEVESATSTDRQAEDSR
jgi:Protein of unknown function (Hypoth_ymh)